MLLEDLPALLLLTPALYTPYTLTRLSSPIPHLYLNLFILRPHRKRLAMQVLHSFIRLLYTRLLCTPSPPISIFTHLTHGAPPLIPCSPTPPRTNMCEWTCYPSSQEMSYTFLNLVLASSRYSKSRITIY